MSNIIITENTVEVTVTYKGVFDNDNEMMAAVQAAKALRKMAVDETTLLDEGPKDQQSA